MDLAGRFHPLLIHFPIALVIVAVAAEAAATATGDERWRTVAVVNVRVGAAFALLAAIAGWRLVPQLGMDATPLLEWHRWLGTIGAGATLGAALASSAARSRSWRALWIYRIALFGAAALVAIAGHIGAMLVWGDDFLHP
jgi:uncharacterized membrane protein